MGSAPDAPPAPEADSDDVSPESLQIVIDVHVDEDQIVGHASDGVTEPRPFSGWLGLIGALDGLVPTPHRGSTSETVVPSHRASDIHRRSTGKETP